MLEILHAGGIWSVEDLVALSEAYEQRRAKERRNDKDD